MANARWKDIVGFEGYYQVSDQGEVRRVRKVGARQGRKIAICKHLHGYRMVSLWAANVGSSRLVHRLVVEAFIGPIVKPKEVNHLNGDKSDNRLVNLEVVTSSENNLHASRLGLGFRGELNGQARITEQTAKAIIQDHADGMGYKRLAKKHGVTWNIARKIGSGSTWRHLKRPE